MERITIMWEITLGCNLDCIFCISKERRKISSGKISFQDALNISNNLPKNSHISFVGGEIFTFPRIIEILKYLDKKDITYEITTNGSLLNKFLEELNALKNLTNLFISIDLYGQEHDEKRNFKGLFENIINIIPKIKTNVNVNSIIFPETQDRDIIKLNGLLVKLGVKMHRISYYMNFGENDIKNSLEKIPELVINTSFIEKIDNQKLRIKTIKIYKDLMHIKNLLNYKIDLDFHPISILKGKPSKCKSMLKYYRVNEYGNLSTCHFIDNEFGSLVNNKFDEIIKDEKYLELKENIIKIYPLDICLTCGKGE